jgi:hypothetical protein
MNQVFKLGLSAVNDEWKSLTASSAKDAINFPYTNGILLLFSDQQSCHQIDLVPNVF